MKIDGQEVERTGGAPAKTSVDLDAAIIRRFLTPITRPHDDDADDSYYVHFSSGQSHGESLFGEVVVDGRLHFTRPEMVRITEILRADNQAKEQRNAAS